MSRNPIKVEIGQKIRNWTVIEFDEKNINKMTYYICECKCGKRSSKAICDLIRVGPKQCKSCACKERNFGAFGRKNSPDMTGKKIGKWIVLEKDSSGKLPIHWKCQCECRTISIISGAELRKGRSKQCKNCMIKHGACKRNARMSEYNSWFNMRARCLNPKEIGYKHYGGRGIKVFPEWINSFERFFAYMGKKPTPIHSIDRIDVDGNYEPGNVRWASPKEQANNRRKVPVIASYNGL